MIGWTEEKWIEVFDRWLARTARYEAALNQIATKHISYDDPEVIGLRGEHMPYDIGVVDGHRCAAKIALKALEDE